VGNQRYMLALAALFAFADRLADMHGHRKMVVRRYVALTSGNTQQVMADPFPAGQTAAQTTYLSAISRCPPRPPGPADTMTVQGHAADQWWPNATRPASMPPPAPSPPLDMSGTRNAPSARLARNPWHKISAGHPEPADMCPDGGVFGHAVRNS
jgi:hypothetical protein